MQKLMTNTWLTKIVTCVSLFAGLIFTIGPIPGSAPTAMAQTVAGWQINSFDSEVLVNSDATIDVSETVEVNFDEQRHGIYRDIPYVYQDSLGNREKISIAIKNVLLDGAPAEYTVDRSNGWLTMKIGSPINQIIGLHTYQIDYAVDHAILYFDDHDELYWNVTGSDWEVPIAQTTAIIALPEGTQVISADCYVGDYGSIDQSCAVATDVATVAFAADGFLTADVTFPKGVVYEPTNIEKIGLFLADNWLAIFPLLIVFLVIGLWLKLGRDPRHGTVIAEYEPPAGIWAVYAGIFERGTISKQDLVAMIVQMAVKGYLKIVETKSESAILKIDKREITLIKLKEPTDLDEAHQMFFNIIFVGKNEIKLSEIRGKIKQTDYQSLKAVIIRWLTENRYYAKRSFMVRAMFFVLAGLIFMAGIILGGDFGVLTGGSFVLAVIVTAFFGQLMPKRTLAGAEMLRKIKGFRLFLRTAERYRAQWEEKEGIFSEFLPYAIAFNDVKHWSSVFEGIQNSYPQWYQGSGNAFLISSFANDLGNFSSSFGGAITPASPTGSGSGGGGFSGGGFGGGGGGSW